jgi:hypothetical protein
MKTRPIPVTLISILFIIAGLAGIIYHASEISEIFSDPESLGIFVVRVLAIVGGVFTLRGANWARWLLLAWIAFHVVLSFFHTTEELVMHVVIMAITMLALLYPKARAYFNEG